MRVVCRLSVFCEPFTDRAISSRLIFLRTRLICNFFVPGIEFC